MSPSLTGWRRSGRSPRRRLRRRPACGRWRPAIARHASAARQGGGRRGGCPGCRARPADDESDRDRRGLEPDVAGIADAFDVVDGLDLVGLRQEHVEPGTVDPGDEIGRPRLAMEDRRDAAGSAGRHRPGRCGTTGIETVELADDDGRGSTVPSEPSILVADDLVEGDAGHETGRRIDALVVPRRVIRLSGGRRDRRLRRSRRPAARRERIPRWAVAWAGGPPTSRIPMSSSASASPAPTAASDPDDIDIAPAGAGERRIARRTRGPMSAMSIRMTFAMIAITMTWSRRSFIRVREPSRSTAARRTCASRSLWLRRRT